MASRREILGMDNQGNKQKEIEKIRIEKEFLNDIVELLLEKGFFSEVEYMSKMEKKFSNKEVLQSVILDTHTNEGIIEIFDSIIGRHKEKLLLILGYNKKKIYERLKLKPMTPETSQRIREFNDKNYQEYLENIKKDPNYEINRNKEMKGNGLPSGFLTDLYKK